MIKKITLTILLLQVLCSFAAEKPKDSFGPKNLLEWGPTCVNLFNQQGFIFVSPFANSYFSYTRVFTKHHLFVKLDHHSYHVGYTDFGNRTRDLITNTDFNLGRFSIGKVWVYKKWRFAPYASLDYRKGFGDYVVAYINFWEPPTAVNHYESFGTGMGASVNYTIYKRWTVGFESHADYFFQKNNLTNSSGRSVKDEYNYHPNKIALIGHFKIGVLF